MYGEKVIHREGSPGESPFLLVFDHVLHAVTFPFYHDGFGVVQQAVQQGGCQRTVIVEDLGPVLEHAVGGDDNGALLIALTDDLEQQIGAVFIDRQVAQLIDNQKRGGGRYFFSSCLRRPECWAAVRLLMVSMAEVNSTVRTPYLCEV